MPGLIVVWLPQTHAQRTAAIAEEQELTGRQRIGAAGRLVKGQLSRT